MIEIENLTVAYDRHPAIHHLTGRFCDGSLTAVVGPNGAGKSTLIRTIAGLTGASAGKVTVAPEGRRALGYLPQATDIDRTFPIAVHDVVAMGLWRRIGVFRAVTPQMREEIAKALDAVGLGGFDERAFGDLSAGQRQRVLFARVMVADARLILLDEPFTAMDARTIQDLVGLIERWHEEGRTQVVVLHDFDLVRRRFPDTLLLAHEAVGWGPTETVLTSALLARAGAMSEVWPAGAELCGKDR